jgi:hypothetical protein
MFREKAMRMLTVRGYVLLAVLGILIAFVVSLA